VTSLIYDQGTDKFVFSAVSGGSGAPTDADYLVGPRTGVRSAEIVVGTSPGGGVGHGRGRRRLLMRRIRVRLTQSVQSAAEATAGSVGSVLSSVYQPSIPT
jgi:hypothetical protein